MAETGKIDIIVFGATGFTGKCVVQELIKCNQAEELSWAIAGRNEQRLREVLDWASLRTGRDVSAVPIVVADCANQKSLNDMAGRARVIINCCGPYRFYGESVVKACIEMGAHHVDVSGEPEYMETVQLNYHRAAEEKGVFIISACGFDSVPVDLGVIHFVKNFSGVVNSVESYMACSNKTSEPAANIGGMSRKGPSEEARARTYARFRFAGEGWSKEVAEKYDHPEHINEPMNARMVTEISFPDFAYGFTAKSVILSALTILKEPENMPLKGGVLTPGAAFAKTNFLENLAELGVTFKILSNL